MHVVSIKKAVQTGVHRAVKGQVIEVPDTIGKEWIDAKFARQASADEVKAGKVAEEPKAK